MVRFLDRTDGARVGSRSVGAIDTEDVRIMGPLVPGGGKHFSSDVLPEV